MNNKGMIAKYLNKIIKKKIQKRNKNHSPEVNSTQHCCVPL